MSFFDDASLAFLASGAAGKDGKAYSIKPVPVYGAEQITNGDFATDSDWTKGSGWTISGGTANATSAGSGSPLSQSIAAGKKYRVTYDVVSLSQGAFQVDLSYSGTALGQLATTTGTYTDDITSINPAISIRAVGTTTGSIDNVSVQEISNDGDFTFTRGSNLSATRVNSSQLIEKGRENLLLQSNQFDTTWTNTRSTETSGQSGYDGTSDAWLLESTATATSAYLKQNISNSGVYTMSVYAKAGTSDWLSLNTAGNQSSYFDLENGVLGSATSNVVDSSIESIGNGWYRCSATLVDNNDFYVFIANGDGNLTTNSGDNIYIQDSQLEQGLVATPYIETGASTAQAGILENTPRFDYSGGATCPSLLLEPSRTNVLEYSEYFDSSYYTKASGTSLDFGYLAPDGTNSAYKLSGNTGSIYAPSVIDSSYSRSIWARTTSGTGTAQLLSYFGNTNNIFNITEEWQRFEVSSLTTSIGDTNFYAVDLRGVSTLDEIIIWGGQAENASYPTSYIPTYGASQTRASETCNGAGNASTFNDSEGVLYAEISALDDDGTFRLISLSDGTTNNRLSLGYRSTSNAIYCEIRNANVTQAFLLGIVSDIKNKHKVAVKYKENDFSLWINGVEVATDNSGITPLNLSKLNFDSGQQTGSIFFGKTNQVLVFPTALSDTELATLTTI